MWRSALAPSPRSRAPHGSQRPTGPGLAPGLGSQRTAPRPRLSWPRPRVPGPRGHAHAAARAPPLASCHSSRVPGETRPRGGGHLREGPLPGVLCAHRHREASPEGLWGRRGRVPGPRGSPCRLLQPPSPLTCTRGPGRPPDARVRTVTPDYLRVRNPPSVPLRPLSIPAGLRSDFPDLLPASRALLIPSRASLRKICCVHWTAYPMSGTYSWPQTPAARPTQASRPFHHNLGCQSQGLQQGVQRGRTARRVRGVWVP